MTTPMRQQYLSLKSQYPDCILFFRLGDFYETFDEDAKLVAKVCDVVLTSRPVGNDVRVPLAGVPYHSVDGYVARLIEAGHRVAIAEQLTEPGRGLVEREVTRVVSKGTVVEPGLLEEKRNNYLAAVSLNSRGTVAGLAYCDITTGEFAATEIRAAGSEEVERRMGEEISRLQPSELIPIDWDPATSGLHGLIARLQPVVSPVDAWQVEAETAARSLMRHFQVSTLDGFGLHDAGEAIRAAAGVLAYLQTMQPGALQQLDRLYRYEAGEFMTLDESTRRNLELTETIRSGDAQGSLLDVLDVTLTPMGGRLLRRRLNQPLLDVAAINRRLDALEALYSHTQARLELREILRHVGDLERWTNRVVQGVALPRDLVGIREVLRRMPAIGAILQDGLDQSSLDQSGLNQRSVAQGNVDAPAGVAENGREPHDADLNGHSLHEQALHGHDLHGHDLHGHELREHELQDYNLHEHDVNGRGPQTAGHSALGFDLPPLPYCEEVLATLEAAIAEDPPATLATPGMIAPGYSQELDDLVEKSRHAKDWIANLEHTERERLDIKSLKVGYNKVFGYYIEVTHTHTGKVPEDYIRKQTLTNAERYITPELKEYETLVLNADERRLSIEQELFRTVCGEIAQAAGSLLTLAAGLAELDVYAALAEVALTHRYVRPEVDEGPSIEIFGGRHPVVELTLVDEPFVPNDTQLTPEAGIHVLTGPNMAGKSTYLRQTALITLMAQIGAFVPVDAARIGVVDRIFTRIGASDEIHRGQSTFMVEMVETANILNHATHRSLLVLDEIGRGTSTYDGLAIAWSVVEYLHNHPELRAKTLFATHYHELTELAERLPHVVNYNVAVDDSGDGEDVVFLRRIIPGKADRSYGVHVARMAGLPNPVVVRAEEILEELERSGSAGPQRLFEGKGKDGQKAALQVSLFADAHPAVEALRNLDVNGLTPLEALNRLYELQQLSHRS